MSSGRGRGAFFHAKYGGRGRGGRGSSGNSQGQLPIHQPASSSSLHLWEDLSRVLNSIDGQQYGAYKRLLGKYNHHTLPDFTLSIDHVQADAYAAPSRISVRMDLTTAGFPDSYVESDIRQIALADYLSRIAADFIRNKHMDQSVTASGASGWSGPKGGVFSINSPAQEVLPRTSALITSEKSLEMRFTVSLPARGRTVMGHEAKSILCDHLPQLVKASMLHASQSAKELDAHIQSVENQAYMRSQLNQKGLVAFVGNGSILPRASGASARPLSGKNVVAFQSPSELEVSLKRIHGSDVVGMGIRRGVTLLTGGGYHGKSTLLEALQLGIYNHLPGDGRELIVADSSAVKIRAEDGRSVTGTDISPFINNLPGGRDTKAFTTEDASGSTSMAANIQEALELDASTIIVDEDTSATNLLVRDERMLLLIKNEPITPLVSKVRALYDKHGVSIILVVGGLGDWLNVADTVIGMESYVPKLLTKEAKRLVMETPRKVAQNKDFGTLPNRSITFPAAVLHNKSPIARRKDFIQIYSGDKTSHDPAQDESGIDVSGVEQLIEMGQTRMIAHSIRALAASGGRTGTHLKASLADIETGIDLEKAMPERLQGGDFVAVRRFELGAAISRLRGVQTGAVTVKEEAQTGEGPSKKARISH